VLKYTLGALAALAILGVTAFVVITQVTDSNAGVGPAVPVTAVVYEDRMSPASIDVKRDTIIELRFDNQSSEIRTIIVGGGGVEILPQLPVLHEEPPVLEIRSSIAIDVAPVQSRSILIRFTRAGEYEATVNPVGTFKALFSSTIVVK
jgi:hypothetical protein